MSKAKFGRTPANRIVHSYRMENRNGMVVKVLDYGATIHQILLPSGEDREPVDICLGYKHLERYLHSSNPYMGATIGRVCNRIAGGKFSLNGKDYNLYKNNGQNSLHGGLKGFDKFIWGVKTFDNSRISFFRTSPDMEEGYPGNLLVMVDYCLNDDNELEIEFYAEADADTPINLTNHAYFNLGGEESGREEILRHEIKILAEQYTPVAIDTLIPTGEISSVNESAFDLREFTDMGSGINKTSGYDHNYVLGGTGYRLAAEVRHPPSGRRMECWTDQCGLQFYTGNFLGNDSALLGKSGRPYEINGGFCLETQNFPDAINRSNFPDCVLKANTVYERKTTFKFFF